MEAIQLFTAGAAFVGALGAVLNGYFVSRLNGKFDQVIGELRGRVNEQGENLRAHVNAPGLHAR